MQPADYTVGWICALPLELAAAEAMLDETHPPLPQDLRIDENSYTLGRIGPHNVVIAALPLGDFGNIPASIVAHHMKSSFHEIRFVLLVGIGSGVPGVKDVRLGDVVVSSSSGRYGGVVQYDRGKERADGTFELTGSLPPPPKYVKTALTKINARYLSNSGRLTSYLPETENYSKFTRAATQSDVLFPPEYRHIDGQHTCEVCDHSQAMQRKPRMSADPEIHYGIIASGNSVIENGVKRNKLSKGLDGVLCFETEAAGVLHTFPCLVIKGISDYADSHKNDSWQCYAAMCAAAFAKELLEIVPGTYEPSSVHSMESLGSTGRMLEQPQYESNGLGNIADIYSSS